MDELIRFLGCLVISGVVMGLLVAAAYVALRLGAYCLYGPDEPEESDEAEQKDAPECMASEEQLYRHALAEGADLIELLRGHELNIYALRFEIESACTWELLLVPIDRRREFIAKVVAFAHTCGAELKQQEG